MQTPILSSTFFLTLLLLIGLFFFIRASTKDRIEVDQLVADQQEELLLERLQSYFTERAYRLVSVDSEQNQVTFEGFVQPSWFLAIFLTVLASIGLLCLVLVLVFLWPDFSTPLLSLVLLAPAAGVFYWKRSARLEKVSLQVEPLSNTANQEQTMLRVQGHRDELAELRRSLNLRPLDV